MSKDVLGNRMAETILVVEDEPALQETLAYNLKRQGYRVEVTGDGIDVSVGYAQTSVVGLGNFRNNQARFTRSNTMIAYFHFGCHNCIPSG